LYAAAPFYGVDMLSRPLTWSITLRLEREWQINLAPRQLSAHENIVYDFVSYRIVTVK